MVDIKKYAVIVAGGKGVRMGNALPKQFLPLLDKPILAYSIQKFIDTYPDIHIILVLPEDFLSYAQIVLKAVPNLGDITIITGGATRYHSVQNGLNCIEDDGLVFVHDGARPLLTSELLLKLAQSAQENGSAIPVIPVAESLRCLDSRGSSPVNRDLFRIVQTPQVFKTSIIKPAFQQEYLPSFTDEATVVESQGHKVHLVEGIKQNIKITTPEDFIMAEAFLKSAP